MFTREGIDRGFESEVSFHTTLRALGFFLVLIILAFGPEGHHGSIYTDLSAPIVVMTFDFFSPSTHSAIEIRGRP